MWPGSDSRCHRVSHRAGLHLTVMSGGVDTTKGDAHNRPIVFRCNRFDDAVRDDAVRDDAVRDDAVRDDPVRV